MLTRANWVNDVGYVNVGGANLERTLTRDMKVVF